MRYEPVEEEKVISLPYPVAACRDMLEDWCEESRHGDEKAHEGLVFKPAKVGYHAFFQFDSSKEEGGYYYKNYFLRVWLKETPTGCDIHYQRVLDTLTGRLQRPFGFLLMIVAVLWLILMRETDASWVYIVAMLLVWAGAMLAIPRVERREQGELVGELLEQAVAKADWSDYDGVQRIGVFGGTFDPIHNGHLRLARAFAEKMKLDQIILIPSAIPPHKMRTYMASGEDRLAMCRLAVAEDPLFTVSDIEIARGGASFTVDTLEELTNTISNAEFFLLTGADMFLSLSTWKRFPDIARMATLCTAPRDDGSLAKLQEYAAKLERSGARCKVMDLPLMPVSSTAMREAIATRQSTEEWLHPAVAAYIREHGLYQDKEAMRSMMTDEQYIEIIRGRLTEKRFHHSLEVAKEARRLAEKYGADPDRAYTAGLLHDILKDTDGNAQLQILKEFDILQDDVEKNAPKLWHSHSGAVFLERVLGVEDQEIIRAVRYHTTARAGMSLLEKILYLADFTSADRDYPDVDEMRRRVEIGIAPAMEYALEYSIRDLIAQNRDVHPDTIAAYNEVAAEKAGD